MRNLRDVAHRVRKNRLPFASQMGYFQQAPAKSGAGIGVPVILKATHDAPSVFFCAVNLTHPFFRCWYIIQRFSRVMVAQAGEPQGSPVSFRAGYANPVWATTSEIGVSGGSVTRYLKEAATCWLLPLPQNRNLSGLLPQSAATVSHKNRSFTVSLPFLNTKPAAHWLVITSAFSRAVCRLRRCAMFDDTPLELDEIIDQCRALAYAAVNTDEPQAREILLFVLQERIDHLYRASQAEAEQAGVKRV
ncbi:Putative prophage protein [Dickeya dadantii 3937]|uniref:Putative prophage protein n=2 Tax=Dickeya dadantii TaxID=204038 RepID=E0SLX2_DICD3|nr:Putative prophage protein [Dickeya dadantii 3937]